MGFADTNSTGLITLYRTEYFCLQLIFFGNRVYCDAYSFDQHSIVQVWILRKAADILFWYLRTDCHHWPVCTSSGRQGFSGAGKTSCFAPANPDVRILYVAYSYAVRDEAFRNALLMLCAWPHINWPGQIWLALREVVNGEPISLCVDAWYAAEASERYAYLLAEWA